MLINLNAYKTKGKIGTSPPPPPPTLLIPLPCYTCAVALSFRFSYALSTLARHVSSPFPCLALPSPIYVALFPFNLFTANALLWLSPWSKGSLLRLASKLYHTLPPPAWFATRLAAYNVACNIWSVCLCVCVCFAYRNLANCVKCQKFTLS